MALEVLRWGAPERLLRAGLLQSLRPRLPELLGSVDEGVRASALALLAALLPHVAAWSPAVVQAPCAGPHTGQHLLAFACWTGAVQAVTGTALT